MKGTGTGVITNPYGFYSLSLPEGFYTIEFSYIGYKIEVQEFNLTENIEINVNLGYDLTMLSEVTVIADENIEMLEKSQMSQINLKPQNLNNMPEFAGEVGLIKTLQTLPGIKTHSDGSAFFFVRGGNKDQNLVLIDDAPVFNHAHLFGYYSAINPDVAQDIKVYTGDMPVNEGDRLSSIIDIHTKQGNLNRFEANGMLNPFIYGLSVEGPTIKGKSSFYLSFRHSNFKWLYKARTPNLDLYLYDINAKVNFKLNKNNRIYFTFFHGKDNLMNTNPSESGGISWENFAASIRWNHVFNKKLFSNTSVSAGMYNYYLTLDKTIWNSEIQNVSAKTDFTWYLSPENTVRFGYNLSFYDFNPGNLTYDTTAFYFAKVPKNKSRENVFYLSDEYEITDNLSCKIGFRLPVWTNVGPTTVYLFDDEYNVKDTIAIEKDKRYKSFVNFDPRISFKYKLGENSSIKLSYGIYHQYLQMLSNSISPFSSFEVWLPSGTNIKPQRADLVALGYIKFFKRANLKFTTEVYYKSMKNQIDYEPHANLLLNPLIEGELRFGTARSYGVEFMLKRTKGKLTGWMTYTLSRTLKKINGLNNDKEFPAYYDRPHDFSIYISYQISERTSLSANWIYYTGSAITTPVGFYDYNGYSVPLYGDKNNDRLPDYHRLDLSLNWRLNRKIRRFQHSLSFGIYNVYNRANPVSINFNKVETKEGKFVVPADIYGTNELISTQKYLLGIMPSITYKFKI
ncbi:MAG: hypothetical protein B6D61_02275 [Bacteroidetes bacterium 4484_249]|nr:MAG: hypothetical protein B6D61_02275 [Bacteroidetes bacterium 4484_249]